MESRLEARQFLAANMKRGLHPLFFYDIISTMNRAKLKVLITALKEVVDELDSEIYSDTGKYIPQDSVAGYDEVFDDDDGYPD